MKRLIAIAAFAAVAACGGDSSTAPKNPTFPSVAGVFAITGSFDASTTIFSGTVTLVQPSREQPTLTGTCNLVVYTSSGTVTFSTIDNASISESGTVGFNVGAAGGQATWRFTGVLSGNTISGTHNLSDSQASFTGTFTAVRQ